MICPNCNKKLPEDSEFCQYCGNQIKDTILEEMSGIIDDSNAISEGVNSTNEQVDFNKKNKPHKHTKRQPKERYCKMCGSLIDSKNKKCTSCEKKYSDYKIIKVSALVLALCAVFVVCLFSYIIPLVKYNNAVNLLNAEKYDEAYGIFKGLDNFNNSDEKALECRYNKGVKLLEDKNYDEANKIFEELGNYMNSSSLIHYHNYEIIDVLKATCKEDGYEKYKCEECGDTYTDIIKTNGHNYAEANCTKPKICIRCGKTFGAPLEHTTEYAKCIWCGKKLFETLKYSGYGQQVVRNINLPKGTYVISGSYSGEGNFIVKFHNSINDNFGDLIFNEVGSCEKIASVEGPVSDGYIDVEYANGSWSFSIEYYD